MPPVSPLPSFPAMIRDFRVQKTASRSHNKLSLFPTKWYTNFMIEEALRLNGFTDKEVKIYLAVLEAGEATVGRIATRTKLKRTTVYTVIEGLIHRGLLSEQARKGIKRIAAFLAGMVLRMSAKISFGMPA